MRKTRTLVASLVAIVICFAMLIGSTYAWFTDSVINTNNIIRSGNIDVELWHASNGADEYEEVNGTTKLFVDVNGGQILWEPGVNTTEDFQIKNVGSLALKYEFRVKALSKSINAEGKTLADIITMSVVDAENQQSLALFGAGYVVEGTLLSGETADYKIELDWFSTELDNAFANLKMFLGIELVATQVSYESDGYGTGFDDGIDYPNISADLNLDNIVAGQDVVLETKGEKAVSVNLPAQLLENIDGVESLALVHTEPVVVGNTVVFDSIELVDQNGTAIDLSDNTAEITVTLPAQPQLANMPINVYHDGELVASVMADENGVIEYTANHFCQVVVEKKVISTQEQFDSAIANGDTIVYLANGEFKMPKATGKTLEVYGSGEQTVINVIPAGGNEANGQLDYSLDGAKVTFENLTIKTNNQLYAGYARLSATYNNCTIQNTYNCGVGNSVFNNCVFNITSEYLRANGAYSVEFNGCTFNTIGRAILVYQDGTSNDQKVLVKDCTFNASESAYTWDGKHVSAVSIDGTFGKYTVEFEGDNVVGEKFNGLWQIKKGASNVTLVAYTFEEFYDYIKLGACVKLGADIEVDFTSTKNFYEFANVVIDGNGHTITQSENCYNQYALFDSILTKVVLKNVTFDGIKGGSVLRTKGAETIIDNVTIINCEQTQQQGLLRLLGKNTVTNSIFKDNKCTMVITLNYDTNSNNDAQIVQNCLFENNTCKDTAVVYFVYGASCLIDGNTFIGNNTTSSGNGATVYLGFKQNCTVTNNVFENNTVHTTHATTKRVAGALMVGHNAVITGNSFVGNTATAEDGRVLGNDVCASVYYSDIDLSGNYWGGNAPVQNDDYFVEYPDSNDVIINDYLTSFDK